MQRVFTRWHLNTNSRETSLRVWLVVLQKKKQHQYNKLIAWNLKLILWFYLLVPLDKLCTSIQWQREREGVKNRQSSLTWSLKCHLFQWTWLPYSLFNEPVHFCPSSFFKKIFFFPDSFFSFKFEGVYCNQDMTVMAVFVIIL